MSRDLSGIRRLLLVSLLLAPAKAAVAAPTVVIFMIDGLQQQPALVAAQNGATNIKFILDNGVRVTEAYATSPAPYAQMPDGSLPWGTTTSSNVAMHTGTHVFDSNKLDDIFLSAGRSGIRSVFAGGAGNYSVFTNATYLHYSQSYSDAQVVDFGIQHLTNDGARLIRLHPQRIRDGWTGPAASTQVGSNYQKAIVNADKQLGRLIAALKAQNLWDETYIILGADHGMTQTSSSDHPPHYRSSWEPFMAFYGPGLKQNATIPYAETPDIALMAAHFLGIERPRGYDASVNVNPRTPTATFLSNLFAGAPQALAHPQYIRRYLVARNWAPPDPYTDYRSYMLSVIAPPRATPTATPRATPTGTATPTATPSGSFVEITPAASGVTASTNDGNVPGNAVDNNLGTRWSANGEGQWIRFDLGTARTIAQVKVALYSGNVRRSRFDLQVSGDGASWTTVFAGESSGTTTQEQLYDVPDTSGRYLRYLGHGNSVNMWNSVAEVSLFTPAGSGTPTASPTATTPPTATPTAATPTPTSTTAPTPTATPAGYVEVTPGASAVTASTNDGNVPANTVDNNLGTRWSASGDGQWLRFDLGTARTVGYVKIAAYSGNTRRSSFDLQLSNDGTSWTTALASETSGTTTQEETFDFPDASARYVRYLGHGNSDPTKSAWNSITEVSIFAVP
jgi:hypothetical protein